MRFLILTATAGNGHNSAARAIEKAAKEAGHHVRTVDVLDYATNLFGKWFQGGYETLVKERPWMWGHLYRSSDMPGFNYHFQTIMDRWSCKPLIGVVEEENPDWIICAHSVAQPLLEALRRTRPLRFAVVVTDLHPHRMWLRGHPDRFFVPTEHTRSVLLRRVPGAQVEVVGMPIDPSFGLPEDRSGEPRILVAAGGIGAGPLLDVARAMSALANVTVVCGWNEELLTELAAKLPQVEALGKITNQEMAEQFRTATLLVSKPGGLTMFEALAAGIPFVIYKPLVIPGQEEDNADFVVHSGAGRYVKTEDALVDTVRTLLADPEARAAMSTAGRQASSLDAAEKIIQALELG